MEFSEDWRILFKNFTAVSCQSRMISQLALQGSKWIALLSWVPPLEHRSVLLSNTLFPNTDLTKSWINRSIWKVPIYDHIFPIIRGLYCIRFIRTSFRPPSNSLYPCFTVARTEIADFSRWRPFSNSNSGIYPVSLYNSSILWRRACKHSIRGGLQFESKWPHQ